MSDSVIVVVTGSSGDVGTAICRSMLDDGYAVLGLDIAPPLFEEPLFTHCHTDLAVTTEIDAALDKAESRVGAVIHCAALQPHVSAGHGADLSLWAQAYAVNVLSLEHIVSRLRSDLSSTAPHRVIAIGSVHQHVTSRDIAPYSVSKAALAGWVRAAALDLESEGIVTIGVSCGAINSRKLQEGLTRFDRPAEALAKLVSKVPLGQLIQPSELSHLTRFLLTAEAAHFVGSNLVFDGGITAVLASEQE